MEKAGITSKPCPGCGEEVERKKEEVCPQCLSDIEYAKRLREHYDSIKENEELFIKEVQIPSAWEAPRYSTFRSNQHNESLEPIGKTLADLARHLSVHRGLQMYWGYLRNGANNRPIFEPYQENFLKEQLWKEDKPGVQAWRHKETVILPTPVFELLNQLNDQIDNAIRVTEKGAVEYGKNALFMMNAGQITMDEFEKK